VSQSENDSQHTDCNVLKITYKDKKDFSHVNLIQSARVEQQRHDSAPMKSTEVWMRLEILMEVTVCSNLIKYR